MNDILKKGFLLGLGVAVAGKEKLEGKLAELVEEKELTAEEAKEVLNKFIAKGEAKTEEWGMDSEDGEDTQTFADELGIATKEDISSLLAKVAELEEKLANK